MVQDIHMSFTMINTEVGKCLFIFCSRWVAQSTVILKKKDIINMEDGEDFKVKVNRAQEKN